MNVFYGDNDECGFEIDDESLDFVIFYSCNFGVFVCRDVDDFEVLCGK